MRDLGDIGSFDVVYCSHALEHLTLTDGDKALSEFRRVLRDGGAVMIMVPDLQDVKPTQEVVYQSPMGPITGHDMYYGYHCGEENEFMRHRCGYVQETLHKKLEDAGFHGVAVKRIAGFNLLATGIR
jgi:predicted SAM-dependent methyltransferase